MLNVTWNQNSVEAFLWETRQTSPGTNIADGTKWDKCSEHLEVGIHRSSRTFSNFSPWLIVQVDFDRKDRRMKGWNGEGSKIH